MSVDFTLYTDGACRGNPGPGGWGVIVEHAGERQELYGGDRSTTNNRMELTAAIRGLGETAEGSRVRVVSDSRYVIDGITKWVKGWIKRGWKKADKKPVLNQELWQELVALTNVREVSWEWVEGHTGHPENERADELANAGIDNL